MTSVGVCPKSRAETYTASERLNCGTDKYGTNQYMCVPNKEKTSLVEFCYGGVMELQNSGNCLEVSNGQLNRYNCSGFSKGCPNASFHYENAYIYSACQNINTQDHCYVSDPSCPTQTFNEQINSSSTSTVIYTPTGFTEEIKSSSLSGFVPLPQTLFEDTSNADIVFAVCALIYVAILLMFVVWYRKRRKLRKKDRLITEHIKMDAFDKEGSEKSSLMRCEEKYNAKEDSKDDSRNWAQDCKDNTIFKQSENSNAKYTHVIVEKLVKGLSQKESDDKYDDGRVGYEGEEIGACGGSKEEMVINDDSKDKCEAEENNRRRGPGQEVKDNNRRRTIGHERKEIESSDAYNIDRDRVKDEGLDGHEGSIHTFDGENSEVHFPDTRDQKRAVHSFDGQKSTVAFRGNGDCTLSGNSPNTRASRQQTSTTHTFDGRRSTVSFPGTRGCNQQGDLNYSFDGLDQGSATHEFDGSRSIVSFPGKNDSQPPKSSKEYGNGVQ